ncbi:hypothetical protein ACTXNW_02135 [Enterococcus malodoratus]|uniref:hypothetical protein n=1 Tax=Enterococcus malodoratus TaxID=71451 RepID=UPI003FD6ADD8
MREEKYIDTSLTDEQLALFGIKSFPETEQYIQVNDTRYTLDEFNRVGDFLLGWELTDDQQIVLGALKADQNGWDPFFTIWHMMENDEISNMPTKQQFQVLAAFAEWGIKQEEE